MPNPKRESHRVDIDIDAAVLEAARARLAVITAREVAEQGQQETWLADVGRKIVVRWKTPSKPPRRPKGVDQRGYRQHNPAAELAPFRFTMDRNLYAARSAAMRSNHTTITKVVEAGLRRFAETGKY